MIVKRANVELAVAANVDVSIPVMVNVGLDTGLSGAVATTIFVHACLTRYIDRGGFIASFAKAIVSGYLEPVNAVF